jgi:hypothetical protein
MYPSKNKLIGIAALAATLVGGQASASTYGPLANFDVVNDTGSETHGFEIEIEDSSFDHTRIPDTFGGLGRGFPSTVERYGAPTITDIPGFGVRIDYMATFGSGVWSAGTASSTSYVPGSDSCWSGGGIGYPSVPCDHFGVGTIGSPAKINYRWLVEDAAHPGTLKPFATNVSLPSPNWIVTPGPPGAQPVVRAEIEIPHPEGNLRGDAFWVKIYKTEVDHPIKLENLLLDDALVADAKTEIEWELLQAKPGAGMAFNEGALGAGNQAVVRRYEFYKYNKDWGSSNTYLDKGVKTTYVDPLNGEVTACVVDGCNAPTADELGSFVGRQMAGFNLAAPVPETNTWAMITVGLALLGMRLRRRG